MLSFQVEPGFFPGLKPRVLKWQKKAGSYLRFFQVQIWVCEPAIFPGSNPISDSANPGFQTGKMSGFKPGFQMAVTNLGK